MILPRPLIPGLRFFVCPECGWKFFLRTRDCYSPSGDNCPDPRCGSWCTPESAEEHPEYPTDPYGNLIEDAFP